MHHPAVALLYADERVTRQFRERLFSGRAAHIELPTGFIVIRWFRHGSPCTRWNSSSRPIPGPVIREEGLLAVGEVDASGFRECLRDN